MSKEKLTPKQKEFKELQKKLKRKVRDIGKRGFIFTKDDLLGNETPKGAELRKRMNALKKAVEDIYEFAVYRNPLTGFLMEGKERREYERHVAARKAAEKRRENEKRRKEDVEKLPEEELLVIAEAERMIYQWQPLPNWSAEFTQIKREDKNLCDSILHGAINTLGRNQVARNIKGQTAYFLQLVNQVLYESGNNRVLSDRGGIHVALIELRNIIWGRAATVAESMDITGMSESINESE